MAENRYLKAAGLGSEVNRPQTELSIRGFASFAASKAPAIGGAFVAKKAWDYAIKTWPNHKRGVNFVGSLFTFLFAYGLHVVAGKVKILEQQAALIDRVTDGMCGWIGPSIWNAIKSFWDKTTPATRQLPAGAPASPTNSIDGNEDDIRDMAVLMANSPETIRFMGTAMFDAMAQEGVKMNDEARDAIVNSMQQVSRTMANAR